MRIFLVAFFKYDDKGPSFGFKRIHLQTFYSTMEKAVRGGLDGFCDEAGWYEGVLIEEREEGNIFFHGERRWFIMLPDTGGRMKQIEEPSYYKNIHNLI